MTHLIPTIHPAAIFHGGRAPIIEVIGADLAKAWRIACSGVDQREQLLVVHPSAQADLAHAVRTAKAWMQHWRSSRTPTAVDVETSSLSFHKCDLYSVALAGVDGNDVAVGFTFFDLHTLPWDAESALLEDLAPLLADRDVPKVYQNSPYDRAVLGTRGLPCLGRTIDTLGLHHLIQPDMQHDLGWIGHTYLDVEPWKLDAEGEGLGKKFIHDVVRGLVYNCKDALNTGKLVAPLMRELGERGMNQRLVELQMGIADLCTIMELRGLPINMQVRRAKGAELKAEIDKLTYELRQELNWPEFNPLANTHRIEVYYGEKYLRLKATAWSEKTHSPSTSYKNETIIANLEHPVVNRIVKVQELQTKWATYYSDTGAYARSIEQDGRLHCKWGLGQMGSRVSSSPNCFDDATEVLTNQGWIRFPEAVKSASNLLFAQYDESTGVIDFTAATAAVSRAAKRGEMVSISQTQISLLLTEDHRLLLHDRSDKLDVRRAADLVPARKWTHAGQCAFGSEAPSDVFIKLLCAVHADGSLKQRKRCWSCDFGFKKPRKFARLKQLLESAGEHYTVVADKGRLRVYWTQSALLNRIVQTITPDKVYGPWLLAWNRRAIDTLLAELSLWDGLSTRPEQQYLSKQEANVDWVQALYVLSGRRARKRSYTNAASGLKYPVVDSPCRAHSWTTNARLTRFPYTGRVHCVSVPKDNIIVRRHGKAVIIKNCQNIPVKDREFIEAPDGWCFVASDKDQLELRIAACRAGIEELLVEMRKPDGDPHTMLTRKVWGPDFDKKSKEDRKKLRDANKNVVYASIYEATLKTIWHTCREKKILTPEARAMLTKAFVAHVYNSTMGRYFELKQFYNQKWNEVQSTGKQVVPPFGRTRVHPVPSLANRNEVDNYEIQPCLPASARIDTPNGLRSITACGGAAVSTPRGVAAVAHLIPKGRSELLQVTFADGSRPELVTPNHKWLCCEDSGYRIRCASGLKLGSYVCEILPELPQGASERPARREWPYWVGAMISDASTSNYQYLLFFGTTKRNRPSDLPEQFYTFAGERGWNPRRPEQVSAHLKRVLMAERGAGRERFLDDLAAWGYNRDWTCHTKRVPEAVFQNGSWAAQQFLWGLLEANGAQVQCGTNERYSVHMCNRELLQDVQDAARFIRVASTLQGPYKQQKPGGAPTRSWRLDLHGYDVENVVLRRGSTRRRGRRGHYCDLPRMQVQAFLATVRSSDLPTASFRTVRARLAAGGSTTAWTLREMYHSADAPAPSLFGVRTVKSMKLMPVEPVYTLRVAHEDHLYLNRGLITKNCGSDFVGDEMLQIQYELETDPKYAGACIVLHGHDACVIECKETQAEAVKDLLDNLFGHSKIEGPRGTLELTAKACVGKNLREAK